MATRHPVERSNGKMHIAGKSIVEMVAQEWYVLAAYFGTFILLEIRKYGEQIAMHRVARHHKRARN
jgi:hypothetical protein